MIRVGHYPDNKNSGVTPVAGLILILVISGILISVLTNMDIISRLQGQSPPSAVLEVSATSYSGVNNRMELIIDHKAGEDIPLRDLEIRISADDESKVLSLQVGSGYVQSLKGEYYYLDTTATNPNSHNPDDIVFSNLAFVKYDDSISFYWNNGGPSDGQTTLTNYFGVVWTGQLRVEEGGDYTFYLISDDGSWLWIDGQLVIDNGGLHADKEVSQTVYLSAGIHEVKVKMFEWGGVATCALAWSHQNMSRRIISMAEESLRDEVLKSGEKVRIPVNLALETFTVTLVHIPSKIVIYKDEVTAESAIKHLKKGIKAYYYTDESWTTLSKVRDEEKIWYADKISGWNSIEENWPVQIIGKSDTFSVKWEGYIYVPTNGDYTFYLTSDDGSWLYIDGQLIIDNGGLHSPRERSGTVYLSQGYHPIEVLMHEHYGWAVIRLEWEKKQSQTPQKEFLNANWAAYYYTDEKWNNLANTTTHGRIRFADSTSGWQSDLSNWPQQIIGETDTFSVKWEADISFPDGDYTFYLTSDDGSWLYIDGELVVDNSGLHAPRERSGTKHLNGVHHFEVKMYEHYGGAVAYLQYAAGSFGRQPVTTFYSEETG